MRPTPSPSSSDRLAGREPSPHHATHLPLVVKDEGPHGVLEGHFAKANPHWQSLANHETLVVFPGPHSYVSPSLYAEDFPSLPGTTSRFTPMARSRSLKTTTERRASHGLIQANDPAYLEQWRNLPDGFRRTMLAGIMGFRIPISRIEGKFKISQNRPEADRRAVHAAQAAGTPDQQALASWMQRLIAE